MASRKVFYTRFIRPFGIQMRILLNNRLLQGLVFCGCPAPPFTGHMKRVRALGRVDGGVLWRSDWQTAFAAVQMLCLHLLSFRVDWKEGEWDEKINTTLVCFCVTHYGTAASRRLALHKDKR